MVYGMFIGDVIKLVDQQTVDFLIFTSQLVVDLNFGLDLRQHHTRLITCWFLEWLAPHHTGSTGPQPFSGTKKGPIISRRPRGMTGFFLSGFVSGESWYELGDGLMLGLPHGFNDTLGDDIWGWYIRLPHGFSDTNSICDWLLVTGTMEWIMTFQKQLGMSSCQLTKSYFSRWLKPPSRWFLAQNIAARLGYQLVICTENMLD